jgi:dolichol-phosphate mannosyltransferase
MEKIVKSVNNKVSVRKTLVVASFREFENLTDLLTNLDSLLEDDVSIVIADDTGDSFQAQIEKIVRDAIKSDRNWLITFESNKSGRGSAVLRGFRIAHRNFPYLEYFTECDADGSHRPADIHKVMSANPSDFTIGSRYLPESKIEGWPISRRVASRLLNFLIPKALQINSSDLTNGLRRYSARAALIILDTRQENTGFIFLSEQALLLSKRGVEPMEVPITFVDRIHGESSVGIGEIYESIKGIISLYRSKKVQK